MSWIIDDIELSTLAFNVVDRSAGWKVPAKRGDNLVIPGRNGAQWVPNKPFEVGSLVLSMWAVGALDDGTVPTIGAEKQVRNNLDKLTALFAQSHKLLNIVQVSSVAYGIKNYITNPGFNFSQGNAVAAYQNLIPNPAPRKRADGIQLTNTFPNPSFNTLIAGTDPTRTNLAPTPHFSYGLGSVTASPNAVITTSNDPDYSHACLSINPNAAGSDSSAYPLGASIGTMLRMNWLPGATYTFSATIKPQVIQSGTLPSDARSITLATVRAGVVNNIEFVSKQAPNVAGVATRLSLTFTVPNDVDDCYIRLVNGSSVVDEVVLFNELLLEKTSSALAYFDGDFLTTSDSGYSWVGDPGNSSSIMVYAKSKLYIPVGYGNLQGGYTLTDKNWNNRIPKQVSLIKNSGCDVFFPVELHEENNMHKYFLTQLRASDSDWALAEGDGGNQCLYRPSKYVVTNVINYPFKASRRMSVFTLKVLSNGFTFNVINNHFRADDDDGSSRQDERAAEAKELIAWVKDNNPINLTFVGDFNSVGTSSGYPRDTFKKAGWYSLLERGSVVDGQYSTKGGTLNGAWIEDIFTKLDVGVTASALIKTEGSSDHFGWLKTTYIYDTNVTLGYSKTYENIFVDPMAKRRRLDSSTSTLSNFYTPSNYETFAINDNIFSDKWNDGSNFNSSMQATTASDKIANPDGGNRLFQSRATANVGSNATIGNKLPFFFTSSDRPLFRMRMRRMNSATTSRSIQVRVSTCKSDGTIGSSGSWQTFAVPSGNTVWTDVVYNSGTLQATSTYNYVTISFRTNEAWTSGDGIMMDLATVNQKLTPLRNSTGFFAEIPGPHFDGASSWPGTYYNSSGNAATISKWDTKIDTRWSVAPSTSASSAYYAFVQTPAQDASGTTYSFHSMGLQTGGTQQFTMACATPAYIGKAYALRFKARGINGLTYSAELLKQGTSDSTPISIGSVSWVGSGTSSNTDTGLTGTFNMVAGPSYIPVSGDKLFVRFTVPVILSGLPVMQTSVIAVSNSTASESGDTLNSTNAIFAWEGERYNSKTLESRHQPKRVVVGRGSQMIYPVKNVDTSFFELYCLSSLETPSVVLDAQQIVTSNGYYFGIQAYGVVYDDGIKNSIIQCRTQIEFLDDSNSVLFTALGNPTVVNNTGLLGSPTEVFVQVSLGSIPVGATKVRPTVLMSSPIKGTGLLFNGVSLLNVPVSSSHLGRVAQFNGSSGSGYSWLGVVDDSSSVYTGKLLTRWSSSDGGQIISSSEAAFKGGPGANGKPNLTISTLLDSQTAGRYLYGFTVASRNEDRTINSYIPGRVNLSVQFLNSGTIVNTFSVTTLYGVLSPSNRIQGMFDVTGSFNEIRYKFESTVVAPVLYVKLSNAYLYADTAQIPVQHLNTNKIFNPRFYNMADQWTVSGTISDLTSDSKGDNSIGLSADATLVSNRFSVSGGTRLKFATWARNNVVALIKFYNSSNVLISTVYDGSSSQGNVYPSNQIYPSSLTFFGSYSVGDPIAISQTEYKEIKANTFDVPTSATTAEVVYASQSNSAELKFSYVGVEYSSHEDDGYYDPLIYSYFDGSYPDIYASPSSWLGEQDNSISAVTPAIPKGWVVSNNVNDPNVNIVFPTIKPPGSTGLAGGLVRAPKGTTRVFRTLGVYRTSNKYLSGQIAVSALPGANVTVSLYQATSATATGSLMLQRTLSQRTGQVFVWNDLPMFNDYIYLQISYTETQNAPGYRVWMDNLSFVMTQVPLETVYPGYFDGNQGGGGWSGEVNNSVSVYYGGGRRAYAEVKEAIDMTSMAGGTRAEFAVSMEIPGSFWEDLVISTLELNVPNGQLLSNTQFDLDGLAGTTAPIDDSILHFDITGEISDLMIQDVATGGWLKINGTLPSSFTIDNGNFSVLDSSGNSLITSVTRGGSNQLVPIVPVSSIRPPALNFSSNSNSTGSCAVTVTARRRYVIA